MFEKLFSERIDELAHGSDGLGAADAAEEQVVVLVRGAGGGLRVHKRTLLEEHDQRVLRAVRVRGFRRHARRHVRRYASAASSTWRVFRGRLGGRGGGALTTAALQQRARVGGSVRLQAAL